MALVAARFRRSCGPGGSCNFFAGFGPIQDSAHSAGAGKHGEAMQEWVKDGQSIPCFGGWALIEKLFGVHRVLQYVTNYNHNNGWQIDLVRCGW